MKKTVLTLFLLSIISGWALSAQSKPEVTFKKDSHDFGTIYEEIGTVSTQFEFTNTGKSPVIIQRVHTSCGCATPGYTREPVLPGKKGHVSVRYTTTGRPYAFSKNITVYTNVPDTVYILNIKGKVIRKGN